MTLFEGHRMLQQLTIDTSALCKSVQSLATKQDLQQMKDNIMSAISDWAASEQANLTAIQTELTNISTAITALDAQIVALQNSPGTLSTSDQAALDNIQTASAALVTQAQAINLTPPPAPAANVAASTPPTPNTSIK